MGKTKIARLVHNLTCPHRPFVARNLAEIGRNFLRPNFLGIKKGPLQGPIHNKPGLIEAAHGGTLFLDEIGALPPSIQTKLLRVLEERTYTPLGATREKVSDFRLITATCEDLGQKEREGEFRPDFYFRIKGVELEIPPLKERRCDIVPLMDHFIEKSDKKVSFSNKALKNFVVMIGMAMSREHQNFIKECMSFPRGLIQEEDLPLSIQNNINPFEVKQQETSFLSSQMEVYVEKHGLSPLLNSIEKSVLEKVIERYGQRPNEIVRK